MVALFAAVIWIVWVAVIAVLAKAFEQVFLRLFPEKLEEIKEEQEQVQREQGLEGDDRN